MVVDESLFGRKTKTKGRGGALPARAAVISAAVTTLSCAGQGRKK